MYICLCNGVSQQNIIDELKKDKPIVEALATLWVGTNCGQCLRTVSELFGVDKSDIINYYKSNLNNECRTQNVKNDG